MSFEPNELGCGWSSASVDEITGCLAYGVHRSVQVYRARSLTTGNLILRHSLSIGTHAAKLPKLAELLQNPKNDRTAQAFRPVADC